MNRLKMIFLLCLGMLISCAFLEGQERNSTKAKKYNLSICAVFKNEAKSLKEWLEYHQMVGVDHFYLYNNSSSDPYMDILKPYIQEGVVTLVQWPYQLSDLSEDRDLIWLLNTQISAYENAARFRAIDETKWLVFVDLDEYLLPPSSNSLREILERYDAYPGIILAKDYFDSSPDGMFGRRSLVIESSAKVDSSKEIVDKNVEKTIFKPDQYEYFLWAPYRCVFKGNKQPAKLSKREVRINRYINRSVQHLFSGKSNDTIRANVRLLSQDEVRDLLDESADHENSIYRYVPDLRKKVGLDAW